MKKYFSLVVVCLFIVFVFSNMSYQQQTIIPQLKQWLADEPFYNVLSKIEVPYWGTTISVETRGYHYFVEFLIRKGFHFVGFGMLAVLFYLLYRKFKLNFAVLLSIGTTFIIANLDEYRQTFVPGRTGVFNDVLLDTAGAVTFVFLSKILLVLRDYVRKKNSNSISDAGTKTKFNN